MWNKLFYIENIMFDKILDILVRCNFRVETIVPTDRVTKRMFESQGKTILGHPPPILQIMILKLSPPRCVISKESVQQKWIDELWFRKQLSTCLFVWKLMGLGVPPRQTPPSQDQCACLQTDDDDNRPITNANIKHWQKNISPQQICTMKFDCKNRWKILHILWFWR
jgi:hypothetical protein